MYTRLPDFALGTMHSDHTADVSHRGARTSLVTASRSQWSADNDRDCPATATEPAFSDVTAGWGTARAAWDTIQDKVPGQMVLFKGFANIVTSRGIIDISAHPYPMFQGAIEWCMFRLLVKCLPCQMPFQHWGDGLEQLVSCGLMSRRDVIRM